MARISTFVFVIVLVARAGIGQQDLGADVERFLGEKDDDAAAKILEQVIARPDATGANVITALSASGAALAPRMDLLVPWRDQLLAATVLVPEGHARTGARLPVLFDISGGSVGDWLKPPRVIRASVPNYTPPEFSDEGRDGFLKVLRTAAHLAHGDPDRLWLCGFSWAGHASFDTAMHRPDSVRGIVPMGGGPRRAHFRVLANLKPTEVHSFCGKNDDQELIWNLREVERVAPELKIAYKLRLDPAQGHSLPLAGQDEVPAAIDGASPREPALASSGVLVADGPFVESPFLRIDAVDAKRVEVPQVGRIPVSASLSADGKRRATIKAMEKKVVRLKWKREDARDGVVLTLESDGVQRATVLLRASWFPAGRKVTVKAKGKTWFSDLVAPDARTLLEDARRTGDRLRPALRAVRVEF